MAELVTLQIDDPESLAKWLDSKPAKARRLIAIVIASRVALRVLPLLADGSSKTVKQGYAELAISILRCLIISRVAATHSTREMRAAARAATAANNAAYSIFTVTVAAINCVYVVANNAAYAVANDAAAHATFAADAAADATIWETITRDAVAIDLDPSVEALRAMPLWSDIKPPDWWRSRRYFQFLGDSSNGAGAQNGHWDIWNEWFNPIIIGQPAFNLPSDIANELEKRIALGNYRMDFWDRKPQVINAEIAGWLAESKGLQKSVLAAQGYLNENILPIPFPAASQFEQGQDGKIVIVADPASAALGRTNQDLIELYVEARGKILALKALGKNRLGSIEDLIYVCAESFPENIARVSSNRLWSKINTLRGILELHETEVAKPQDIRDISVILDATVAFYLSDAVKQSNLFIAFDEKGRELDRLAHGPELRQRNDLALAASQPIIIDVSSVADNATVNIVIGDHNSVTNASKTIHGDQAVERVVQQESNFYVRLLLITLRIAKAFDARGMSEPASQVITAIAGQNGGAILEFVIRHKEQLHKVADAFGFGTDVQKLIDLVAGIAANFLI